MEIKDSYLKSLKEIETSLADYKDSSSLIKQNIFEQSTKETQTNPFHNINNLDSEIYSSDSFKQAFSDDILLEQKIIKLKQEISNEDYKIQASRSYGSSENLQNFINKRNELQKELDALQAEYSQIPLAQRVKNKFVYSMNFLGQQIKKINVFCTDSASSNSAQSAWKTNLQKLNNLNKEIDDILSTNTPYGESEKKYERLSASLNKALALRQNLNK